MKMTFIRGWLASSFFAICITAAGQCSFSTTGNGAGTPQHLFSDGPEGFTGNFNFGSGGLITTPGSGLRIINTPAYVLASAVDQVLIRFTLTSLSGGSLTAFDLHASDGTNTYILCASVPVGPVNPGSPTVYYITAPAAALPANTNLYFFLFLSQTGSFHIDDFGINASIAGVLPVKFTEFKASLVETGVRFDWSVGDQEAVDRYEVEKSTDARRFEQIGAVEATTRTAYTWTEMRATGGFNYYRIKAIEKDGKSIYSHVLKVLVNSVPEIELYPVPTRRGITVRHGSLPAEGRIEIISACGTVVVSVVTSKDTGQTTIDISSLSRGLYLVRFSDGRGVAATAKMLKE